MQLITLRKLLHADLVCNIFALEQFSACQKITVPLEFVIKIMFLINKTETS